MTPELDHVSVRPAVFQDVKHLIDESNELMASLYPAESNHLVSEQELEAPHSTLLAAELNSAVVGCVAMIPRDEDYAEVKRLFVDPAFRGRGIGGRLMNSIEQHAQTHGIPCLRLEVGVAQPDAVGMYEALGYQSRPPFGHYVADPLSLFYEKELTPR